jgi:putative Ca2+/H+ antiporter (TMEM165/GDT1 family)
VQTFVMTFLGEWGDRSQIATIAMAAGQDYWWVTAGAISGHAVCTGIAVVGGRAIAGRVSLRVGMFNPFRLNLGHVIWNSAC